jgi:UrcA family protein
MKMKKTIALAIAALVAGSLAGMAQATAVRRDLQQQVVRYGDLNLDDAADAAVLMSRIQAAAKVVCGVHLGPVPLEMQFNLQACVQDATSRAVSDVNAPLLSQREITVRNAE